MTYTQFLLAILITGVILIIVRLFWKQLLIIYYTIYILGSLTILSLAFAIGWVLFFGDSYDGFKWLWLYFFLALAGLYTVYALVVIDALYIVTDWIKSFFK
jgi:hypothetical protein